MAADHDHVSRLSERECEVLRLVAAGRTNSEIAGDLFIGMNTVKTYIRTAYRKIGVDSRTQAVVWAFKSGFVPLEEPELGQYDPGLDNHPDD